MINVHNQKITPFPFAVYPVAKDSKKIKSLATYNEEPIAIYYIESGWNYGYPTYHVIIEYGDFEQTDYRFMSDKEFRETFNVDPIKEETLPYSVQLEIPFPNQVF